MHRLPLPPASLIRSLALLALTSGCSFGIYDPDHPYTADTGVLDSEPDADTDADTDSDADSDSDSDTDTDADADTLRITSVTPSYGTTAGNAQVVIKGGPFDNSASVRFGGSAATVDSFTTTEIHVHTPSASAEGAVDVLVSTSASSATLTSGFYYLQDGAGKVGVIGGHQWFHYAGTYWGNPPPTDFGYSDVTFITAANVDYSKFFSATLDTCTRDYTYAGPDMYVYDFEVPSVALTAPDGATITMPWDSAYGGFVIDELTNPQFQQNGSYDLQTVSSPSFPSFAMPDIMRTPSSFTVNAPAIGGSSPPSISRTSLNLTWTGSGGDYILVYLGLWPNGTGPYEQLVTCALRDDGSFTVPSSVWTSWPTNRQLDVVVGRATAGTGTVPYDNSSSSFVGVYWLYGAGTTR